MKYISWGYKIGFWKNKIIFYLIVAIILLFLDSILFYSILPNEINTMFLLVSVIMIIVISPSLAYVCYRIFICVTFDYYNRHFFQNLLIPKSIKLYNVETSIRLFLKSEEFIKTNISLSNDANAIIYILNKYEIPMNYSFLGLKFLSTYGPIKIEIIKLKQIKNGESIVIAVSKSDNELVHRFMTYLETLYYSNNKSVDSARIPRNHGEPNCD